LKRKPWPAKPVAESGGPGPRVAIIGAGPAGFYAAEHLLQRAPGVEIDIFDRLPTPFGLVRYGVAPDHQKIKSVTKGYERVALDPRVRFFGNVGYGEHITLDDLRQCYGQVLFATGAQTDRRMGIPGEDLTGSEPATEFVAWYNGHPFSANRQFDLSHRSAAVVGVGNVAIDVARILSLSPEKLAETDVPAAVLDALRASAVREVHILGRRGPAQAAFTTPELKELSELAEVDLIIDPAEAELDPLSRAEVERAADPMLRRKVELIQTLSQRPPAGRPRRLYLRFFVSPLELVDDGTGQVQAIRLTRTRLVASEAGTPVAEPTGETLEIPAGLVFRSVGYRGVPLPGLPFNERWGVIMNHGGRVTTPETGEAIPGLYVAGWIKRGPSGVIGTNKRDAQETVDCMLADAQAGQTLGGHCDASETLTLIACRQPRYFTFADWQQLDALERAAGPARNAPRIKVTSIESMLAALGQ
jgi:ferredoxin--NADP+ reductase